jgi:hypothetical protein
VIKNIYIKNVLGHTFGGKECFDITDVVVCGMQGGKPHGKDLSQRNLCTL